MRSSGKRVFYFVMLSSGYWWTRFGNYYVAFLKPRKMAKLLPLSLEPEEVLV